MLIQAKKEFVICADLKSEDVFFYYTTTLVDATLSCIIMQLTCLVGQGMDDVEFLGERSERRLHPSAIRRQSALRPSLSVASRG